MCQFQPLARPGKNHRVLADHITFADRLDWNFISDVLCLAQDFSESFRAATGRVLFHAMVRFDDLGTEFVPKNICSSLCKSKKRVYPHAEVGRENNR